MRRGTYLARAASVRGRCTTLYEACLACLIHCLGYCLASLGVSNTAPVCNKGSIAWRPTVS